MGAIDQMRLFFEPRSVAIVGAPRRTGYEHFNLLESIITYGYPGKIYPVNPNADEIFGIKACHNINELPEMVELAQLSRETLGKVEELSPPWFSIGNPVDIWPASLVHGYPKVFGIALGAVLSDKNVDAVLCVLPSPVHKVFDVSGMIERAAAKFDGKPIVIWRAGYLYSEEQVALFEKNRKAVVYPTGERAVRALAVLTEYAKIRNSEN